MALFSGKSRQKGFVGGLTALSKELKHRDQTEVVTKSTRGCLLGAVVGRAWTPCVAAGAIPTRQLGPNSCQKHASVVQSPSFSAVSASHYRINILFDPSWNTDQGAHLACKPGSNAENSQGAMKVYSYGTKSR